jgi:hypothetical protein
MTGHVTSQYQGLNSSEVGAKIENLGSRLIKNNPKYIGYIRLSSQLNIKKKNRITYKFFVCLHGDKTY